MPRKLLTMRAGMLGYSPGHHPLNRFPLQRGDALDAIKHTCRGSLSRDRGINALSYIANSLSSASKASLGVR